MKPFPRFSSPGLSFFWLTLRPSMYWNCVLIDYDVQKCLWLWSRYLKVEVVLTEEGESEVPSKVFFNLTSSKHTKFFYTFIGITQDIRSLPVSHIRMLRLTDDITYLSLVSILKIVKLRWLHHLFLSLQVDQSVHYMLVKSWLYYGQFSVCPT